MHKIVAPETMCGHSASSLIATSEWSAAPAPDLGGNPTNFT